MKQTSRTAKGVKNQVRKHYAGLVNDKKQRSCCAQESSCCVPEKKEKLETLGYSKGEWDAVPADAADHSYGCGNPLAFADVRNGQTVLDIGSGVGIDCFIASKKVGRTGKVIGLDMTPEMIERARQNAAEGGYDNVEFRFGEAEAMPVEDGSVDWVISNCVINLSPDKPKVFREIARVLKPGGRFSISDIVIGDALPDAFVRSARAWAGCVAGAIREADYVDGLLKAGLADAVVESRVKIDEASARAFIREAGIPIGKAELDAAVRQVAGNVWSAKMSGRKGE
ncbi:MAG TPA: arsenite methyltransferase [bacterium]